MSKKEKDAVAVFRKGDKVFSVITAEQLIVDKVVIPKSNGVFAYMVSPVKGGLQYRATEGELDWVSPYAPKQRKRFEDAESQEGSEE